MLASTNCTLKVLTPSLAEHLRVFNRAARILQGMHVRLLHLDPVQNQLTIEPVAARALIDARAVSGFQRDASAGSTRYAVQFHGVTLVWREPISSTRTDDWSSPTLH
ncbi:hypothetical protein [Pseudomonas fluorescens]|uniref:hypothetical protein n=1 Tax=Pseudomonas fluorescens TaxID=294 RepID=UPI0007D0686F|nr:hypothetical protein [Pseudomonas fluorescens]